LAKVSVNLKCYNSVHCSTHYKSLISLLPCFWSRTTAYIQSCYVQPAAQWKVLCGLRSSR